MLHRELHGTAFFLTDDGMFLTAAHVVEEFPNQDPPFVVFIVGGPGYAIMPVEFITVHPTADVALGKAVVNDQCRPCPMTLSTKRLLPGEPVSVLGYPHSVAEYALGKNGEALSRLTCTPDFFEGQVLDHHAGGIGLCKGAAYTTDIAPPPGHVSDLGGASGGPLVDSTTLHVHGLLCSASESYSVFTDIAEALDWEVFQLEGQGTLTIRAAGQRYPTKIKIR